jgi:hypothetical protein
MVPLWQLAQPVVTETLMWKAAGSQLGYPALWQAVQFALVETWLASWPVAVCPLWQLAQLVAAVKLLWLTLVPTQVVVDLWQVSQLAVVER